MRYHFLINALRLLSLKKDKAKLYLSKKLRWRYAFFFEFSLAETCVFSSSLVQHKLTFFSNLVQHKLAIKIKQSFIFQKSFADATLFSSNQVWQKLAFIFQKNFADATFFSSGWVRQRFMIFSYRRQSVPSVFSAPYTDGGSGYQKRREHVGDAELSVKAEICADAEYHHRADKR